MAKWTCSVHVMMPPFFVCLWRDSPQWAMASSFTRFLDHTQRYTTVGRTPLDEWSARRRDLYLTTQNTHNRQTSMPPVGFEPTVSAGERPQTYALDRAATGTGNDTTVLRTNPGSVRIRSPQIPHERTAKNILSHSTGSALLYLGTTWS